MVIIYFKSCVYNCILSPWYIVNLTMPRVLCIFLNNATGPFLTKAALQCFRKGKYCIPHKIIYGIISKNIYMCMLSTAFTHEEFWIDEEVALGFLVINWPPSGLSLSRSPTCILRPRELCKQSVKTSALVEVPQRYSQQKNSFLFVKVNAILNRSFVLRMQSRLYKGYARIAGSWVWFLPKAFTIVKAWAGQLNNWRS